ncbi:bile acid:sodium symporter family protein [Lewinella sp. W8]|uniref:bile acid:sodium symporter family protein n=1 Tax=Lewinella sp. W8 TaxID=2528208 RepID=UPI001067524A|nr:bile acid:sodium symporter family protein [Lewinella sp. W8]MTB50004.1 bile acid:sodium symporter family protein [Lewinella sp. W8]
MAKRLSFTLAILLAVILSLVFPEPFTRWGDFELKKLIIPILMVIMFGMGTQMSVRDFWGVLKMPRGVLIGLGCQFSIMPLIGFGLAMLSGLPPEIAAGIILVGSSPSGLASNVMTFIAGGNLALSLTLTMVATLLAPIVTPVLMQLLADQLVPIDGLAMLWSIVKITFLPVVAGLIFNHFLHGKVAWLDGAMPLVSMVGIALVITVITAAGRDALLTIGGVLIGVVLVHNLLGYLLGYGIAKLAGLDRASARTIALEVGMQNSGLASGIALEMGRVATMGLAPAVFGPLMNTTGSILATYWRGKRREGGEGKK